TSAGGVSSTNPLAAYYADPMAAGFALSGGSRRTTFGNPIFANVNPTSTSSGLGSTGVAGGRGVGGTSGMGLGGGGGFAGLGSSGGYGAGAYGASTTGTRIAPKYSTSLSLPTNTTPTSGLQVNLQGMLSRS